MSDKRQRLFFTFRTQWARNCNWYDFDIVRLFVMRDKMLGAWEFNATLMGLAVDVEYIYDFGPRDDLSRRAENWITREQARQE